LICLSAPSDAFTFTALREDVSFTAKILATASDSWPAYICEEVKGLSAWVRIGVRVEEDIEVLP
jgi:hypothetical protein